ncbi:MAG: phosphotransferase [Chloroflexota bacterium]
MPTLAEPRIVEAEGEVPPHVQALLRAARLADPEASLIQTHISWVILAGPHAYKLKKPVNFGFVDFSTRALRLQAARNEVTLNRRFSPWAYRGVRPLVERDGQIRFAGRGCVLDYVVWMRRLPADRMLDVLVSSGLANPEMLERIADRVVELHLLAPSGAGIDDFGAPEAVLGNIHENADQTEPFIGRTIDRETWALVLEASRDFIERRRALLQSRMADGYVRDCHGDLHAKSICVTSPITVFDCLEFSERLRRGDVASEVAFLAMDLEFLGHPELAGAFVRRYIDRSGDRAVADLMDLYVSYRAYVRGKVESLRLAQPGLAAGAEREIAARARRYFELAGQHAARL